MIAKTLAINPLDAAVLLYHLHRSAKHPEIGYNDAETPLDEISKKFNNKQFARNVSTSRIEAALYCCNLMNEQGQFWHPLEKSFDDFLRGIAVQNSSREPMIYNKFFNYFEDERAKQMVLTPQVKPDTID